VALDDCFYSLRICSFSNSRRRNTNFALADCTATSPFPRTAPGDAFAEDKTAWPTSPAPSNHDEHSLPSRGYCVGGNEHGDIQSVIEVQCLEVQCLEVQCPGQACLDSVEGFRSATSRKIQPHSVGPIPLSSVTHVTHLRQHRKRSPAAPTHQVPPSH
jgi:hypothetical protein